MKCRPIFEITLNPILTGTFANLKRLGGGGAKPIEGETVLSQTFKLLICCFFIYILLDYTAAEFQENHVDAVSVFLSGKSHTNFRGNFSIYFSNLVNIKGNTILGQKFSGIKR